MANQTKIVVTSSGQEITLPGTSWTAAQLQSTFADTVPGIGSMNHEVTVVDGDNVFTFRPRTGTKG